MKLFILLASIALAKAGVPFKPINVDYHTTVGIPLAAKIEQAELAQDFDGSRIIGGSLSSVGQHPYMAGLLIRLTIGAVSMCGSTLLTNTRVVTAAHCWATRTHHGTAIEVVLGSVNLYFGGTRVNTNNIQMHPNYNMDNFNNDVAVIVMPWVTYTNNIRNIPMASGSNSFAGQNALAAGFGLIADVNGHTDRLHHVTLQVITNADCARFFGTSAVIGSTLCTSGAGGRNTCVGDSGGPLVLNNQLIGITSFGPLFCEAPDPSAFARVTSFNSWISAHL
ncbi:unnamed protein product, partial [Brenthis ino]